MIVDACVHPCFPKADDLRNHLPKPYSDRTYNQPYAGSPYPAPIDEYVVGSRSETGERPGADPSLMETHVLGDGHAEVAVLLPLTRGLLGDAQETAAIDAATNEWLAATWLDEYNGHGRYRGSIRIGPRDPDAAIREIERWADHPLMVQVAVPLEATTVYGDQRYFGVWEAAAEHGLPVALHSDYSGGVLRPPTVVGWPFSHLEWYSQCSLHAVSHLASLIAHGVFERLDSLKVVFADGGFDYVYPLMWRLDKDWRATGHETPWVVRAPSEYLGDHVRIVMHRSDGSSDQQKLVETIEVNGLERILLFASNYPHWDHLETTEFSSKLPDAWRRMVMGDNAADLYGL